jgi:hypothetical protein
MFMKLKYKYVTGLLTAMLLICSVSYGQLNPLSIGIISPGDSIVIYYDVTINTPCGCTQISNQGTITGSNFSNVITDDPKTGAANDPTITLLNMFPLPVNLLEFTVQKNGNEVKLTWKASEVDVERYDIERSANGAAYSKIASLPANGNGTHTYSNIDAMPLSGKNYYRLKMIDQNGSIKYSHILLINLDVKGTIVKLYPNPVIGKSAVLQYSNLPAGDYKIEFVSSLGQVQLQRQLRVQSNNASETLRLERLSGIYFVRIVGIGALVYSSMVMID